MNADLIHFLRPTWLLALPLITLVWWIIRRRAREDQRPGARIAPHLAAALTINSGTMDRLQPIDLTALTLALLCFAAAGPAWRQLPSPWFAEAGPLVVAVEVSNSMLSNDVLPTRLDRARFKILDLLAQRTGARTALIAYAGSAHVVMPPTSDIDVVRPFLEGLDPAIMPAPGAAASGVLPLARNLLGERAAIGTLLFVNDGFEAADLDALSAFTSDPAAPGVIALVLGTDDGGVALLADGTPATGLDGRRIDTRLDRSLLQRIDHQGGVAIVRAESGDGDVHRLLRLIESNLRAADDPDARWQDEGWWFLWPAALLILFAFRRGWVQAW